MRLVIGSRQAEGGREAGGAGCNGDQVDMPPGDSEPRRLDPGPRMRFPPLVVVGEAGIGNRTMWLAALEARTARGFEVLACRPSEAEARFSCDSPWIVPVVE